MRNLKTQIRLTMALGAFALLASLMTHLALTDIYHGETDVSLEWSIVRLSAMVMLVFIGMALYTLGQALRRLN